MTQNRSHAVMAQRAPSPDSLDYFPTPPWGTRALCEYLARHDDIAKQSCWEPACGEGHMARALGEYFSSVVATDIHDYGAGYPAHDFLDAGSLMEWDTPEVDWIITNPPFNKASAFALRGIALARVGVALLVRTSFLEGGERYRSLFRPYPPTYILQFSERIPMFKGRLNRAGSSATAYCWILWVQVPGGHSTFKWLPPGTRARFERDDDYAEQMEFET